MTEEAAQFEVTGHATVTGRGGFVLGHIRSGKFVVGMRLWVGNPVGVLTVSGVEYADNIRGEQVRVVLRFHEKPDVESLKSCLPVGRIIEYPAGDGLKAAHQHCFRNREEVLASTICGCFYCRSLFSPSTIEEWTDDHATALCPKCGTDAVVGDESGFRLSSEFLDEMHGRFF